MLPFGYRILDRLTGLNDRLLNLIQYAAYFAGVAFVFELREGAGAKARVALGISLLLLSAIRFLPFWTPRLLCRSLSLLDLDSKLELAAARNRSDASEIEKILRTRLDMRASAHVANYVISLVESEVYKLLHM